MKLGFKKALLTASLVATTMISFSATTFAGHNTGLNSYTNRVIDLKNDSFTVSEGEVESVKMNRLTGGGFQQAFVSRLIIKADGHSRDTKVQVLVNGEVKGTLAGSHRNEFTINVKEIAQSIQFYGIEGKMKIKEIQAELVGSSAVYRNIDLYDPRLDCDNWTGRDDFLAANNMTGLTYRGGGARHVYGMGANSIPSQIALSAIQLVTKLQRHTNHSDTGTYLLPIKKAAARVYAVSSARGILSMKIRKSMIVLYNQIVFARDYIDNTFEVDAAFMLGLNLLQLAENMDAQLD